MPILLVQIALILILVRCAYRVIRMFQAAKQDWLEILFQVAVFVVALWFLIDL